MALFVSACCIMLLRLHIKDRADDQKALVLLLCKELLLQQALLLQEGFAFLSQIPGARLRKTCPEACSTAGGTLASLPSPSPVFDSEGGLACGPRGDWHGMTMLVEAAICCRGTVPHQICSVPQRSTSWSESPGVPSGLARMLHEAH